MSEEETPPLDSAHGEGDAANLGPTYVEALADDADYWLSLTDAARVTRRQEVTIRRWVASGQLPVRRQPIGLNKRTRHVRASDLAQLSPIIDPGATISGVPANVDLVSIPLQQAQILSTHQEMLRQMTHLYQTLTELAAQRERDLIDQQMRSQLALGLIQEELIQQLTQLQTQVTVAHQQLVAQVSDQQDALNQLAQRMDDETRTHQNTHQEVAGTLTTHTAQLTVMQRTIEELSEHAQQSFVQLEHQVAARFVQGEAAWRHHVEEATTAVQAQLTQRLQAMQTLLETTAKSLLHQIDHLQMQQAAILHDQELAQIARLQMEQQLARLVMRQRRLFRPRKQVSQ